jgi:hypothetical protein
MRECLLIRVARACDLRSPRAMMVAIEMHNPFERSEMSKELGNVVLSVDASDLQ